MILKYQLRNIEPQIIGLFRVVWDGEKKKSNANFEVSFFCFFHGQKTSRLRVPYYPLSMLKLDMLSLVNYLYIYWVSPWLQYLQKVMMLHVWQKNKNF